MKKIILLELMLLFLATTFQSDNPPGWYQQQLPVNDFVNDIFFLDSLNGWVVTNTGYIMNTTSGGDNWEIQAASAGNLYSIQFLDSQTGYTLGNGTHGIIYKTTNGGTNWNLIHDFSPAGIFRDMSFVNKDTGWVCSIDAFDGGVFKTTTGGINWQRQINLEIGNPLKITFVNSDTGWFINEFQQLYKTLNGGVNWNIIFTSPYNIEAIFFLNSENGWMRGAATTGNMNAISYTSNGGLNWVDSQGNIVGGFDIKFVNDSIGYSGTFSSFKILKSTNGGKNWGYQTTPIGSRDLISVIRNDTLNAWAGQIIHTNDGGGNVIFTSVNNYSSLIKNFKLFQNYPNPFNPKTIIKYELQFSGLVEIIVYDINGKVIKKLINQRQSPGEFQIEYDGSNLSSGVYFYRLSVLDENSKQVYSESKSMLLIK